jgi:excisionase family DNA binding protein
MIQPAAVTPIEGLWTHREVMALLRIGRNAVYDLAASGALPSLRIGSRIRFDPAKVRAWLERQGQPNAKVVPLPAREP